MSHYSPDDYPRAATIGQLLGRAAVIKDRLLDSHLASLDITAAQFKVLIFIGRERANTPADLCRELSLDSGSMTRMLDRLAKKNLLQRLPCAEDRRVVRLALSEAGQEIFQQTPVLVTEAMNELTSGLDGEELQTLIGLLEKLLRPHTCVPVLER
ncbi:Multiple antibiotic resistance protein MarR [compost metagenome]